MSTRILTATRLCGSIVAKHQRVLPIAIVWLYLMLGQLVFGINGPVANAQTETQPAAQISDSTPDELRVRFGLGNAWKLGQLCPVQVAMPGSLRSEAKFIEVQTVDGDGVAVVYRQAVASEALSQDGTCWIPVRIGRADSSIVVRVLGEQGLLQEQLFASDSTGQRLTSSQPLIVAIGSSMGVEMLSRSSADGTSSTFSTVTLKTASQLPWHWSDYSACDLIVLSCADTQLLKAISVEQWTAIDVWIRRGGGCVVSLGSQAESLTDLKPLVELLPGEILGVGQIDNPGSLESLIATDQPLQGFPCSRIRPVRGKTELTLTDSLSREVPWWLSYAHGHGTLRFIASDLDHESFAAWKDLKRLWQRLLAPYLDRGAIETSEGQLATDSSYLGYSDLVGQLRATLDVFPGVSVISFGQVAAMLVGVLLLIGPVDYFISVKWLKRPDLSWTIAGTMLLAVAAGLTWMVTAIRPQNVHVNTAQIIDLDAATGNVNGWLWSHIYSGAARQLDVDVQSQVSDAPIRLDWQGLPGRGLGGLLSQLSTDRGMPEYQIELESNRKSQIVGVGIPAAGTKCLSAVWADTTRIVATSSLREIPGVDQLEGQLANPLSVDLLDPVLYYHNWYYGLNSRIPAGQSVTISFDTIPKDIGRRLNGRKTVDSQETTTKWDPGDRGSLDRLLELMMLHKSAAGSTYTSLTHRFQPQLDHSNLLETDQAILLGRLEQPWARVQVTMDSVPMDSVTVDTVPMDSVTVDSNRPVTSDVVQDVDRTWCRIAIPVIQNKKK